MSRQSEGVEILSHVVSGDGPVVIRSPKTHVDVRTGSEVRRQSWSLKGTGSDYKHQQRSGMDDGMTVEMNRDAVQLL